MNIPPCINSYGVLLYELFHSRTPYEANTNSSKLGLEILTHGLRPKLDSACPTAIQSLMKECWHQEPDNRPDFKQVKWRTNLRLLKTLDAPAHIRLLQMSMAVHKCILSLCMCTCKSLLLKLCASMYLWILHVHVMYVYEHTYPCMCANIHAIIT
jgi:hypothetical protein